MRRYGGKWASSPAEMDNTHTQVTEVTNLVDRTSS